MSDTSIIARDGITGAIVKLKVIDNGDGTYSPAFYRSVSSVSPVGQASTNPFVDVAGSNLDATRSNSVSYTITNTGVNSLTWQVLAGNASDGSDAAVISGPAALLAAATASFSQSPALYRFYKIQIKSTVAATPGTAVVNGVAKG
jgi:hypothetical protein